MVLKCERKTVSGSGKNQSTHTTELWSSERHLQKDISTPYESKTLLPVLFHIPFESPDADKSNSRNQILWTLSVTAKTPGVDFKSDFDVPVFRTPDSDPLYEGSDDALSDYLAPADPDRVIREEHLKKENTLQGGTRLIFPMMRHKGYAFSIIFFTVIWCGICAGLFYSDAPRLFPYVFSFFGVLILLGTIDVCFTRYKWEIQAGSMMVWGGLFGSKGPQTLTPNEIQSITHKTTTQSGNTSYYTLRTTDAAGKKVILASQIKGRGHADQLLEFIQQETGVAING
jgi:hypothetical protein